MQTRMQNFPAHYRALALESFGSRLTLVERPFPRCGPGNVVVGVRAAGICHSDEHYRAGRSAAVTLPRVLGHECAGEIVHVGAQVDAARVGERVCIHYVVSCGVCVQCSVGLEQFCDTYQMVGVHRDGGYAQYIEIPAHNALVLPASISYELGAVSMCAGATAMHAIKRSRLVPGESVAVIGVGGIGMFAVQIALAQGAAPVFAIDLDAERLRVASAAGAIAVDARSGDAVQQVVQQTAQRGVNVAIESIGMPSTIEQSVAMLGIRGRAVVVGIASESAQIDTYRTLLARESELLGSNDHTRDEIIELLALIDRGAVYLPAQTIQSVPLDAAAVTGVLHALHEGRAPLRTVIVP